MAKKLKLESEKVENMETYFGKEHYEDMLMSDEELEREILFEEDDLTLYNY